MKFNSRVLEMNGKKDMVHQKKWAFSWFLKFWVSDDWIVAGLVVCSRTLAQRLQMHDHQSWSSNAEPGDCRVLLNKVENEQCVQHLIGRAHWDIVVQCHGQLWKLEDRACTWLVQACAAKTHIHKSLNQQALWFHKSVLITVHNCATQYNTE